MYGSVEFSADKLFGKRSFSWSPKVDKDSVETQSVPLDKTESASSELQESVFKDRIGRLSMGSAGQGGRLSKESRFSYPGNVDDFPTGNMGVSFSGNMNNFPIGKGVSFSGNKNSFPIGKGGSFYGNEFEGLSEDFRTVGDSTSSFSVVGDSVSFKGDDKASSVDWDKVVFLETKKRTPSDMQQFDIDTVIQTKSVTDCISEAEKSVAVQVWLMDAQKLGDKVYQERMEDLKAAREAILFLHEHDAKYVFSMGFEALMLMLVKKGHSSVQNVRRAYLRWIVFAKEHNTLSNIPGLCSFFTSIQENGFKSNAAYKGTAAQAVRIALISAVKLFNAPFALSDLQDEKIELICCRREGSKEDVAMVPLSVMFFIDELALGQYYEQVMNKENSVVLSSSVLLFLRSLSILARSGLRTVDGLRCSVVSEVLLEPISKNRYCVLRFSGNKQRNGRPKAPTEVYIWEQGVLEGSALWFAEWVEHFHKKKHILPQLTPAVVHCESLSHDWVLSNKVATTAGLAQLWSALLSLSPFLMSKKDISTYGWTIYGLRTVLPSLGGILGLAPHEAASLGSWSVDTTVVDSSSRMSERYSRETVQPFNALHAKVKLFSFLHLWVGGDHQWQLKIPLQLGEIPHYEFLRGEVCNDGSQPGFVEYHGGVQAEDIDSFSGDESEVVTSSPKKKTKSQTVPPVRTSSRRRVSSSRM
jgi:hypothetical protein